MNGLGRPTTTVQRVDMSPLHQRTSAAPATSEVELWQGYGGERQSVIETRPCACSEVELWQGYGGERQSVIETRPCACGGTVQADPSAPARGVAAHQFTGRHKAWRDAQDV